MCSRTTSVRGDALPAPLLVLRLGTMGADYVGFIGCELQRELGREGFQRKLKLAAFRRAVEGQVPPAQRANVKIQVMGANRRPETLSYDGILEQLGTFEQGCASCRTCMVGEREPLGCYRYVTYPVDIPFEEALFAFFVQNIETKDSIAQQVYETVVKRLGNDTSFHTRGDGRGILAQRQTVLRHSFGGFFSKKTFDSAQLLQAFFLSSGALGGLDDVGRFALMVAYSRLVSEVVTFARASIPPGASQTLDEVERLRPLYLGAVAMSAQGGGEVLVDS